MSRFPIALVRFTPEGRSYPVNNPHFFAPGDRVLVRWQSKSRGLSAAAVTDRMFGAKACRNSIVCSQDDAQKYGGGPDEVGDPESLESFLTEFLKWQKHKVRFCRDCEEGEFLTMSNTAFVRRFGWEEKAIISGALGVGSYRGSIVLQDGAALLSRWARVWNFWDEDREESLIWSEAARWAEGRLAVDLDPPDNTMAQIRSAANGGTGGAGYLGDGIWI